MESFLRPLPASSHRRRALASTCVPKLMARVPYSRELEQLAATYQAARSDDTAALRTQLLALAPGPARMVGTGGTLALAGVDPVWLTP